MSGEVVFTAGDKVQRVSDSALLTVREVFTLYGVVISYRCEDRLHGSRAYAPALIREGWEQ